MAKFDKGQFVEINSGEHQGIHAKIVALQEIEGNFQYGLSGVPGTNGNLYAVHERDISMVEEPVVRPDERPTNGTVSNLADQLRQVADLAVQSETDTDSKYQLIIDRLDAIDKRMEVKEIKVVVEVNHTHNKKEFETYSDEDRLEEEDDLKIVYSATSSEGVRMTGFKPTRVIDTSQLSFLEGEEE